MPGESVSAVACVWFDSGVYLSVSLEIVLTNKALSASRALILTIVEMGLDVGFDVLLAAEDLVAILEIAGPSSVIRGRTQHVLLNLCPFHTGIAFCLLDLEIRDTLTTLDTGEADHRA